MSIVPMPWEMHPLGMAYYLLKSAKNSYDNSIREGAFAEGVHKGELMAAEKFTALLEQSDNMRIGSFAIGNHVARLGGNSDEKLGVIVDALGEPNSFALSDYVRSENNKILRDNLRFEEICNKYLDSLNAEQLKSVDNFLQEIINAGGSSTSEKNFYQNKWTPYLERRTK